MSEASQEAVQQLLDLLSADDPASLDALIDLLHEELRLVAHRQRRRWHRDDTLGTTALVNEAYLKLRRQTRIDTATRDHFLALASRAMRHILSTYSEQRRTLKRGGGAVSVTLDDAWANAAAADDHAHADATSAGVEIVSALDRALVKLEATHPRQCRVVECRFYGGLTVEQTADALRISPRTVKRDWAFAQAWLKRELDEAV